MSTIQQTEHILVCKWQSFMLDEIWNISHLKIKGVTNMIQNITFSEHDGGKVEQKSISCKQKSMFYTGVIII